MLGHPVPRPTNLDCLSNRDFALVRLRLSGCILGLASSSFSQISLMALALSVGQVVSLIVVQSQTKLAFIAAKMIAHEIGIFRQIDGLEGQSPETLSTVDGFVLSGGGATAPRLRTPFSIHHSLTHDWVSMAALQR